MKKLLLALLVLVPTSFASAASDEQTLICTHVKTVRQTAHIWDKQIIATIKNHQITIKGSSKEKKGLGTCVLTMRMEGVRAYAFVKEHQYDCGIHDMTAAWIGDSVRPAMKMDTRDALQITSYNAFVNYGEGYYQCKEL